MVRHQLLNEPGGSTNPDHDPAEPPAPQTRAPLPRTAVGVAIAALAIGALAATTRATTELDRGSSPTTSLVLPLGGSAAGTITPGAPEGEPTATEPPAGESPAGEPIAALPTEVTRIAFDGGLPAEVGTGPLVLTGSWGVVDGALQPLVAVDLPADATGPSAPGEGPQAEATVGRRITAASVRLALPTAHTALALVDEDRSAWLVAVGPDLDRLTLHEVVDGQPAQRGFLTGPIAPGLSLGLYVLGDRIGVTVDGSPVSIESFFGPAETLATTGFEPDAVVLIAGAGTPAFDDLAFG